MWTIGGMGKTTWFSLKTSFDILNPKFNLYFQL